ncbi:MAG: NAD-dependent epimerase/dehydratase family protein [Flavobacteriales bacterium]|nr:NAD-dependent epimerase/dehydratase family protein [Flavobacteriales bacterium]MCW8913164.1 NAD-dependent epimerase/dehydratase family protein [Flavobacteriales bacterium]MCW8937057.1 NAD-dependent epimerase/dehydratase family protein [Flavobacteriales bacterium]MCW8941533.1 NAD-dependent epimerase/dehydratase family protein [Flavobacteriales bacterium]MCW8967433.1 NAD-dependent epimerase/dehydratase family protein [Flavobacteriales bacterium]
MSETILVIGSSGQIGTELVEELRKMYGNDKVVASDIKTPQQEQSGPFEIVDILNKEQLLSIVKKYQVTQVYLLAALLSATAEKNPEFGWQLNMESLFNVLNLAKEGIIKKVYWPSSIAVFGPTTPRVNTPQLTIMEPTTVYGISKQAGERWCEYYFNKYNVDVRSIRYPGLIGYKSLPGGGTTDYAVDIYHQALKTGNYTCFLSENTYLPMMYMPDAIRATIELMHAKAEDVKIRSSYNLGGISFSPKEIAAEIKKHLPNFEINYNVDERQKIADSWPQSIDDVAAQEDWGWRHHYDLKAMTIDMLKHLK